MANAQILLLVRGEVPEATLRAAVAGAGQANGFAAGPSTWASGSSRVERRDGAPLLGAFRDGPWTGLTFSSATPLPAVPSLGSWSALRMNLLNGPEEPRLPPGSPEPDPTAPPVPTPLNRVGDAIRAAFPTAYIRFASRGPRNAVSWDRGVPAPLPLAESSSPGASSSGAGWLIGLGVVAGLAALAARSSAGQPAPSYSQRGRPMTIHGLGTHDSRRIVGPFKVLTWNWRHDRVEEGNYHSLAEARAAVARARAQGFTHWIMRDGKRIAESGGSGGLRGLNGTEAEHRARAAFLTAKSTRESARGHYSDAFVSAVSALEEANWIPDPRPAVLFSRDEPRFSPERSAAWRAFLAASEERHGDTNRRPKPDRR